MLLELLGITESNVVKGYNFALVVAELAEVFVVVWLAKKTHEPDVFTFTLGAALASVGIVCRIGFWYLAESFDDPLDPRKYAPWAYEYRVYLFWAVVASVLGIWDGDMTTEEQANMETFMRSQAGLF